MGYRIEYDSGAGKYEIRKNNPFLGPALFGCTVGLLLTLIFTFWEAGGDYIRDALIPGENQVTLEALETLSQRLRQGESFQDSVAAFCTEILHGTFPAD